MGVNKNEMPSKQKCYRIHKYFLDILALDIPLGYFRYTLPGPNLDWICVWVEHPDTKITDKRFNNFFMESYHHAPRYMSRT